MDRTKVKRSAASVAVAAGAALLVAGCGDVSVTTDGQKSSSKASSPSASPSTDTSAGKGTWLLGLQTAGGADAEKSTTVYLSYNPSTGQATARKMPGVTAASASPRLAPLLVSKDRQWAIPDTGTSHAETNSGKLTVYSLTSGRTQVVDLRQRTGRSDVKPVGWAFDPQRADTLRVVDTANRIWAVNVPGGKAVQEGTLPKGPWVFTNGFNPNTGKPYVESIDSDKTNPAGNGPADTAPVTRDDGTVLPDGSPTLAKLPTSPCRLGAGYTDAQGTTWQFCADKPEITTYYLPQGAQQWSAYGKPSSPVAPIAAAFPLVLPPGQ